MIHRFNWFVLAFLVGLFAFPSAASAAPPEPPSPGDYLLVDKTRLEALPTTGTAWTYLNARANDARAQVTFSSKAAGLRTDPQLRNYEDTDRYGQKILAVALRYARTKDPADRDFVERAVRYVIGTEDRAATDGTSASNGLLATSRNLPAFILAADFIKFDRNLTGLRSGWTTTSFASWLNTLRTKNIGTHGRWKQIVATSVNSANNWGAAAMASRTLIARYLGSGDTEVESQWRRWMGDAAHGVDFVTTADYDATWTCQDGETWPANRIRRPINFDNCGASKAGIVAEDMSRSARAFPTHDDPARSYTSEHLGFILTGAITMQRAGFDVRSWGAGPSEPPTLRLAGDWVQSQGLWPQMGAHNIHSGVAWLFNHLLGTTFTTKAPVMGRMISYADWWGASPM